MTHITLPRAVVEQALEALEAMQSYAAAERKGLRICDEAITALRAALAQQAEPVSADAAYQRWLADTHAPALRRMDSQGAFAAGWQAALAQQAEPVCKCDLRTRLVGDGCEVCNPKLAAELARQAEPEELTMERLRDALVASRIIPPAAVEDPEGYDDGVTLYRIEALHRRIT